MVYIYGINPINVYFPILQHTVGTIVCTMQHTVHNIQHTMCSMQCAAYSMQHAVHSKQCTACSTCNMQYVCNVQYTGSTQ